MTLKRASMLLSVLWPLLVIEGCDRYEQISVPERKSDFVGQWSAGSNFFELEEDGDVSIEIEGAARFFMSRSGSLRSFEGELICIGVGEWQQADCLPISASPYASGGQEVIRIIGVELARRQGVSVDGN
jgi:hypothetical protein